MSLPEPYPDLDDILASIGEAGARVSEMGGSAGAAGNISVYVGWPLEARPRFSSTEPLTLPQPAPALAGGMVIVTGSGRHMRDIRADPEANLGIVRIGEDGQSALLYTSPRRRFARLTTEFNSHLAVHDDQVARTGSNFHALVHAQPPHLTYLSHIPAYRDQAFLNRQLMRWEAETIMNLPEGLGVLPFMVPGSAALMEATLLGLREHRLVLWSKHGVMARSELSATRAADRIEYAESAARFEYMNLVNGGRAEGLTREELRAVVEAFDVPTSLV